MGGSVSKDTLESHRGLLDLLCGPAQITPAKLDQLFLFNAPLASLPPLEVETAVAGYCGRLRKCREHRTGSPGTCIGSACRPAARHRPRSAPAPQ